MANNVNDWVVDFLTTDGMRLRFGPLAIGWFDPVSGQQVILATIRNATGALTAPNEITFGDCFEGLKASIRITYLRAGMSSDLILHEAPADPQLFGLSDRSRLELYTEVHPENPQPAVSTRALRAESDPQLRAQMAEPDLLDTSLDFGAYKMGPGAAFESAGANAGRISVAKRLITTADGRRVLIESIEYREAQNLFAALPQPKKDAVLAAAGAPVSKPARSGRTSAKRAESEFGAPGSFSPRAPFPRVLQLRRSRASFSKPARRCRTRNAQRETGNMKFRSCSTIRL